MISHRLLEVDTMSFLQNLSVKKVSFVRRGANKRKFLLLKSEDVINHDQIKEEEMQELVKAKVMEILKSEQDPTKVVALLKADKEIEGLELTDEDFTEVQTSIEFLKAIPPTPPVKKEEPKPKEEPKSVEKSDEGIQLAEVVKQMASMTTALESSNAANKAMAEKLEKQEKDIARRDIVKWLTINCPYLPADVQKTADEILLIQEQSESAAQIMKDSLQRTSAALQNSDAFGETGNGSEGQIGPKIPGSALLKEIKEKMAEVKKSGDEVDEPAIIRSIVNGGGRNNYLAYRNSVIQRSKLAGFGPDLLESLL